MEIIDNSFFWHPYPRAFIPCISRKVQTGFRVAESTIRARNYESAGIINEHFLQDYGIFMQFFDADDPGH